ncbi:MAG TPA: AAA family ATPase [Dehalococcoidia bacterium]|nr:AAA family ATPase [Dehalococcoidia bacterium]
MPAFDVRDHLDALRDPACYPEAPSRVDLAETHISCVFLMERTVYKLKKPVDFGFVDYSTRALRHRFCQREVELNRRLTDDIYLGVVPLVRTVAGLRFTARGRAVDWAVRMRRVSEDALWSRRLAARLLGRADLERLAAVLAAFHAGAVVRAPAVLAARDQVLEDTLRDLTPAAGGLLSAQALSAIGDAVPHWRSRLDPLLRRRLRAGRFVDGHGDLRLEHVFERDGRVQALDCVEFSPALRRLDAAADLAFLLMDLDRNERPDLALDLVSAYLRFSGDGSLPLCDRFYRAERALVRAKVDLLAQASAGRPQAEVERLRRRAARWTELAAAYLQPPVPPALLLVRGVAGTGKTALATRLAAQLGFAWLSSDVLRRTAAGRAAGAEAGEAKAVRYAPAARRAVYTRLHRTAGWYLARGFGVVLDATYLEPALQAQAARLAARHGVPARALSLQAPPAVVQRRLGERAPSASEADWSVARQQIDVFGPVRAAGLDEVAIDAGGSFEETWRQVLQAAAVAQGAGG